MAPAGSLALPRGQDEVCDAEEQLTRQLGWYI